MKDKNEVKQMKLIIPRLYAYYSTKLIYCSPLHLQTINY